MSIEKNINNNSNNNKKNNSNINTSDSNNNVNNNNNNDSKSITIGSTTNSIKFESLKSIVSCHFFVKKKETNRADNFRFPVFIDGKIKVKSVHFCLKKKE